MLFLLMLVTILHFALAGIHCDADWYAYGPTTCFKVATKDGGTWYTAREKCSSFGSELASIDDVGKQAFVASFINAVFPNAPTFPALFWLGLKRLTGNNWQWIDGSSLDYQN